MQFLKAFISTILIAAPMALAAPRPDDSAPTDLDNLISDLVNHADVNVEVGLENRDLETRGGWTCAFLGGNKGCQVKVQRPWAVPFQKNEVLTDLLN